MSTPSSRLPPWAPVAAFALLTAAVFAASVRHHWFIGDDAYISFRYAQHLVEGHGLVFNPGERVEGYTNFLWVVLMALGMALGLDPEPLSLWLGTACGAGVVALIAYWGSRRSGWSSPLTWVAPLCLSANRTFTAWCSGGLETQLFTLLVVGGYVAFFDEDRAGKARPWGSSVLFALAALTRPEGVAFYGLAWLALVYGVATKRRTPGALGWFSGVFTPIVGAHEAWRIAYYGAPLPNTFYAKVSGAWWSQGFDYLWFFATQHVVIVPLALIVACLWLGRRLDTVLPAVVLAFWSTYLAYVGGDRFEFRLVTHALPFLYFLAAQGLVEVSSRYATTGARGRAAVGVAAALLVTSALLPTYTMTGATWPHGVNSIENVGAYATRRSVEGKALGTLRRRGLLPDDTVIAVTGAGALPYFAGLPTVDLHGLNDAVIARQPVAQRGEIGHEKYASLEYLKERKVAIWDVRNYVVQLHRKACPKDPGYDSPVQAGQLRCVEKGGHILAFATTLDEEEFQRTFDRFHIVY